MSYYSEVIFTVRCDHPDCTRVAGPDPSLATLRSDLSSEADWWTNGYDEDFCAEHRYEGEHA